MFFFFNDTATTKIYTLSLHDALPILLFVNAVQVIGGRGEYAVIEADNVCFASAIGVQRLHTHRKMIDPVVQPVENSPVAGAPTIDRLFHIAHNQTVRSL